jgi:uncharacterized protein with von Willebrand factor type A (vWA) domain
MSIDKIDSVEDPHLENILRHIHDQSTGIVYTDTEPTADTTPNGKMVIYDDGTTKRIYYKTGKGNLGYINLT